jgi:hypothetical protein
MIYSTNQTNGNGMIMKTKYLCEGFTPPSIFKSHISQLTYITPFWLKVPPDTTSDQIEWTRTITPSQIRVVEQ